MSVNITNFNFNFNNTNGVQNGLLDSLGTAALDGARDVLSDIFNNFAKLFDSVGGQFQNGQGIMAGGCVTPPTPFDGCHPSGSLKADENVVTTPGGYKIEATGQHEWKITGPDGKTTRVWGDPHVAEGDGGKWDFKRDSTFVLGDGTRINVTTKPWGDGKMTVTGGLEIISGNDRVQISDIDKGKGKIGPVTQDGWAHANSFSGKDTFVMGNETDDWSFQGKEVIGSNDGGESFKLGNDLPAGGGRTQQPPPFDFGRMLHNFVNELMGNWNNSWQPNPVGSNPYSGTGQNNFWAGNNQGTRTGNYDRGNHQHQMRQAFRLVGDLFNVLSRLSSLSDQMNGNRYRALSA